MPNCNGYDDFIWSTSEQSKEEALLLFRVRSLIEKHGCELERIDLATNSICISCQDENGNEDEEKSQELAIAIGEMFD